MINYDGENDAWDAMAQEAHEDKESGGFGDNNSLFLRMEKGKTYQIRLMAAPLRFRMHWQAFKPVKNGPVISPAYYENETEKDVAWSKGGWKPQKRFAAPVLNRELNKIQLLEAGPDVFNPMFDLYTSSKAKGKTVNPAGDVAPDWTITVSTQRMKNGKDRTTYSCQPDIVSGMNPLTEEEQELKDKFMEDWQKYYEPVSPEELAEMWESLPDDKKFHPNRRSASGKAPQGAGQKTAARPAAQAARPAQAARQAPAAQAAPPPADELPFDEDGGDEDAAEAADEAADQPKSLF